MKIRNLFLATPIARSLVACPFERIGVPTCQAVDTADVERKLVDEDCMRIDIGADDGGAYSSERPSWSGEDLVVADANSRSFRVFDDGGPAAVAVGNAPYVLVANRTTTAVSVTQGAELHVGYADSMQQVSLTCASVAGSQCALHVNRGAPVLTTIAIAAGDVGSYVELEYPLPALESLSAPDGYDGLVIRGVVTIDEFRRLALPRGGLRMYRAADHPNQDLSALDEDEAAIASLLAATSTYSGTMAVCTQDRWRCEDVDLSSLPSSP